MRPIITLRHAVSLLMLGYALGVLVTPNSGVTGFIVQNTALTPILIAFIFAGCAMNLLIAKPKPALFSLLTTPILLYSVASILYVTTAGGALTGTVAHVGVWTIINASLYERARNNWNS